MTRDPSVKRYRKKPVVIEAMQLPTDGDIARYVEIADWLSGVGATAVPAVNDLVGTAIRIPTLEGDMLAQPGDWIIRGVAGEFYPCKPDIFDATYEEVR